ncbi:MAG TPA: hypothetical protein VJB94_00435 [Candidatus Nanoarchaeia archaeon]|nr:hypothetical protein [Candidatus Nanoarchaeia archaeon]
MTLKNIWSLQVGEIIASDYIKKALGKSYEIFIPLNNQLKDYDLVLMNQKTKKVVKIQVKESREYNLGQANGWFSVSKDKVLNKVADFYIFLIYTAEDKEYKKMMTPRMLIIPSDILLDKSKNKKDRKNRFDYYFKIQKNKAWEDRDVMVDYSEYINNFNLLKI